MMAKRKTKIAICYDFDGTLAPGNMHEHSLLPQLKITPSKFWKEVKALAKKEGMNEILSYMYLTIEKSHYQKKPIKKAAFRNYGKKIKLFRGLDTYFDSINAYANEKDLLVEHYIISSGLREIIEGTSIKKYFKHIFASEFLYEENGVAIWPALAIDYTNKTQYLFRINKGIMNAWDNTKINKYVHDEDRYIPFSRIIYLGDGETDIPAMKMVNYKGGYSIAVYDQNKRASKKRPKTPKSICLELVHHKRATFIAPANFTKTSALSKLLRNLVDKIATEVELQKSLKSYKTEIKKLDLK